MKPITEQSGKKAAFTIVELLTVMSIIIILIGLLVPALNRVRRYAKRVIQKNQFHAISVALDLFNNEWEGYLESDSSTNPQIGVPGFGAVQLCEAVMGWDLLGYTPNFNNYANPDRSGREPYLPVESANVYKLKCLYPNAPLSPYLRESYVLCDVYKKVTYSNPDNDNDSMNGKRVGMPILYYRANVSGTTHSVRYPFYAPFVNNNVTIDDTQNIYNYTDNDAFVQLGIPWGAPGVVHLMASGGGTTLHGAPLDQSSAQVFYNEIWNDKIADPQYRPYRADSYILMSAGFNGEYGGDRSTGDDVFNFGD